MKQPIAPKWLLTTSLLAVLGANYGFQTSSLALHNESGGSFELSSETSGGTGSRSTSRTSSDSAAAAAPAPTQASTPPPLPVASESKKEEAKPAQKQVVSVKYQGKTIQIGTCEGDCSSVTLQMADLERFAKSVASMTATVTPSTVVAAASTEEEKDDECVYAEEGKKETRAQRRDRLRCEKAVKEREKREERLAKFEDKMEDIKDKCEVTASESKIECLSREYNNALSRFSGRNGISPAVAQRYFKSIVGSELAKILYSSDLSTEESISMIQDLLDGVPSEYTGIRKSVLDAIQAQTRARAVSVNQQFQLADTYKNNPQAYLQQMGEAQQSQAELMQMSDVYTAGIRTSDAINSDNSLRTYYEASYVPAIRRMFTSIGSTTGIDGTNDSLRTSTRLSRGGSVNTLVGSDDSLSTSTRTRGELQLKTTNGLQQWDFLNDSSGVRSGAPSPTSRGSTRGARQLGQ